MTPACRPNPGRQTLGTGGRGAAPGQGAKSGALGPIPGSTPYPTLNVGKSVSPCQARTWLEGDSVCLSVCEGG